MATASRPTPVPAAGVVVVLVFVATLSPLWSPHFSSSLAPLSSLCGADGVNVRGRALRVRGVGKVQLGSRRVQRHNVGAGRYTGRMRTAQIMRAHAAKPSSGGRIDVSGLMLPPDTKEESIKQSATAVENFLGNGVFKNSADLPKKGKKKGRESGALKELMELQGKKSARRALMAIEMSIGAEDPTTVAEMVEGIVTKLPKPVSLLFGNEALKEATEKLLISNSGITSGLLSKQAGDGGDKASLLIVGAAGKQLPAVVQAVEQNTKTHIVLLNAEFTPAPPTAARSFVERFEVVYSVLPLEIQGFMGNAKGAIFRAFEGSKSFFWRSFKLDQGKEGRERWEPVGSWKARPNSKQLEDSMYGSGANNNPINKGLSGFRNLFGQ